MKIISLEPLIDTGNFRKTDEWKTIEEHIQQAIKAIEWPPGSGAFTLHDQSGKKRGEGNGVKPIKASFMPNFNRLAGTSKHWLTLQH